MSPIDALPKLQKPYMVSDALCPTKNKLGEGEGAGELGGPRSRLGDPENKKNR